MCRRFGTAVCPIFIGGVNFTAYEDGTERSETSAHKIQTPGNHPKKEYNVFLLEWGWMLGGRNRLVGPKF
jgi:hypothetical protein